MSWLEMSPSAHPFPPARPHRLALAGALALVTVLTTIWFVLVWVPRERLRLERQLAMRLTLRATVLETAIEQGIASRFGDARLMARFPSVGELLRARGSWPVAERGHLVGILQDVVVAQELSRVTIVDSQEMPVLSTGSGPLPVLSWSPVASGPRSDLVGLGDGAPRIVTTAPVFDGRGRRIGAVVLEKDPERWLYPLLRTQWTGEASAEALLVRVEGDSARLLSPVRFGPHRPLTLVRPVRAVDSASSRSGLVLRRDYRGERAYVVVTLLRGAPWGLAMKVDETEIVSEWRRRVRQNAIPGVLALLASVGMIGLVWRAQRGQLELERGLAERRLGLLVDQAADGILVVTTDGTVTEANRSAAGLYRAGAPLPGRQVTAFCAEPDPLAGQAHLMRALGQERYVFNTVQRRDDGTQVPVEVSTRLVDLGNERRLVLIVRDRSEAVAAQARIDLLQRLLVTRSAINRYIAVEADLGRVFEETCRIAVSEGDFERAWVGRPEPDGGIIAVARAGEWADYLDAIEVRWDESPPGQGPTGRAVRLGLTEVVADRATDPRLDPWRRDRVPLTGSTVAVPIRQGGQVTAVLTLVARTAGAFDGDVLAVVEELAADLSLASDLDATRQGRAEAERALSESEQRLRLALDAAWMGIFDWDIPNGRITWSEWHEKLWGFRPGEFAGTYAAFSSRVHPDDLASLNDEVARCLASRETFGHEFRVVWPDGTVHWIASAGQFDWDDAGAARRMRGTVVEVTDRKAAEAALQDSEVRYRSLFAANPQPMWAYDLESRRFLEVNDAAVHHYGYSRDDFLRMTIRDIRPVEELPRLEKNLRTPKADLSASGPWRHRKRDGSVIEVEIRSHTLNLDGRPARLVQATDVTEQRRAEAAIRVLNRELDARVRARTAELAEANRELEGFSHSVSHDLRAPLRAIDGFVGILEEDYAPSLDAEGRRLLAVVRNGAVRMGRLIDDLLAFARVGRSPISRRVSDMASLVRESWLEATTSEEQARVSLVVGDLPPVPADPSLLRQVWINLLSNAVKFSSRQPAPRVEVSGVQVDDCVEYAVRDNGVGFDMAYAAKLFGVFQRLHAPADFEGTGVGLALVHRIVTRHGGTVRAEGAEGQGATFRFTLPLKEG